MIFKVKYIVIAEDSKGNLIDYPEWPIYFDSEEEAADFAQEKNKFEAECQEEM